MNWSTITRKGKATGSTFFQSPIGELGEPSSRIHVYPFAKRARMLDALGHLGDSGGVEYRDRQVVVGLVSHGGENVVEPFVVLLDDDQCHDCRGVGEISGDCFFGAVLAEVNHTIRVGPNGHPTTGRISSNGVL